MKLERLLKHVEAQLERAVEEDAHDQLIRLYTLLSSLRKERIEELEREQSKLNQEALKLKLAK